MLCGSLDGRGAGERMDICICNVPLLTTWSYYNIVYWLYSNIGEGNGNPLKYSCLENPVDKGAGGLLSIGLHRVGHDWSDLACTHALEKGMATHSSIPAWRIPGAEKPDGLPYTGSHRVTHDWSDLAAAAAYSNIKWNKKFKLKKFWLKHKGFFNFLSRM